MTTLDSYGKMSHDNAKEKGFWDIDGDEVAFLLSKLALIHSEASETLEAIRKEKGEEEIANDLASVILSGGRTSRLVNAVREKQRLVTSISAYLPSHRHNGLAIIGGRCAAENLEPARESIFIEIDRLLREGLRDGEEERVRRQLLVSHVYLLESNSDVAGLIGYSQVILGNTDLYTRYTEVARTIPIERALDVIRRTFVREAASMCSTGPALPEATPAS